MDKARLKARVEYEFSIYTSNMMRELKNNGKTNLDIKSILESPETRLEINNKLKEITEEQMQIMRFEEKLNDLLDGKTTQEDIESTLGIKFEKMINKISGVNIQLYSRYVSYNNPTNYRPHTYTHIDYEALLIYLMKQQMTLTEAAQLFGVNRVTINKNIKKIDTDKTESLDVISLYREYASYIKCGKREIPQGLKRQISELEIRPVILKPVLQDGLDTMQKRLKLLEDKKMTRREAAEAMGISRQALEKSLKRFEQINNSAETEK